MWCPRCVPTTPTEPIPQEAAVPAEPPRPEQEPAPEPDEPDEVYSVSEEQLVAERLEALGYLE